MLVTVFTHFMAFFKGSQLATYKIKAEAEAEAREYEKATGEAESKGLQRERKLVGKGVATDKPDPFK